MLLRGLADKKWSPAAAHRQNRGENVFQDHHWYATAADHIKSLSDSLERSKSPSLTLRLM